MPFFLPKVGEHKCGFTLQYTIGYDSYQPVFEERFTSYQSVFADDEQAFSSVELGQADLLVESAVPPHYHGDTIGEAPLRDVRRGTQD